MDMIFKLFSGLFILLDTIIYWAVDLLYRMFILISEAGVFTPENIKTFGNRIYILLGVFMLFKVSFSFINYILNPDSFSDNSKGVSKLLMNFFVVLVGIVSVPYIFQAAYSLQSIILSENVIGNLVMGMNSEVMDNNNYDYIKQGGKMMSYTTLSAFIRLNPEVVGEECASNPVLAVYDENNNPVYENNGIKAELNPACINSSGEYPSSKLAMEVSTANGPIGQILVDAYSNNDVGYLLDDDLIDSTVNVDGKEKFIFDYSFLLSTLAGGFLAWMLLVFCIDISIRSVKLGFLQLIAPIPIISYIDPKNGKEGIFKKWTNECVGTFLGLFVRLLAIYFVLFILTLIINGGISNIATGETINNFFVKVFIIFGALMFANELPKLISGITGVNMEGGFTINPLKKVGGSPFAAGALGLVGGAVGGMAANAWAIGKDWRGQGFKGTMRNVGSVLAGGSSAGFRTLKSGLSSAAKGGVGALIGAGIQASNLARNNRKTYAGDPNVEGSGYSWKQRRIDDINKFANKKEKGAGVGLYDAKMKEIKKQMDNVAGKEQALRNAQAVFEAEHPTIDFSNTSQIKERYNQLDSLASSKWNDYEEKMKNWNAEELEINASEIAEFRQFQSDYAKATADMDLVKTFDSFEARIDAADKEFEQYRKEYKSYEDAFKTREQAKKS